MQKRIHSMFSFALNQNEFMFLRESDTLGNAQNLFRTVDSCAQIFRNKGDVNFPEFKAAEPSRMEVWMDSRISLRAGSRRGQQKMEKLIEEIYKQFMDHYVLSSLITDLKMKNLHV